MAGPIDEHPAPDPVIAEAEIAEAVVADASTHHRGVTEDDLVLYRTEYLERDRRIRRTDRQMGFLFLLTFIAFFVLAYRVEANDDRLAQGLYNACVARVATANQYNIGRESLVQQAIVGPNAPKDAAAKAALAQQLRAGLLLPIEECGPPPGQ